MICSILPGATRPRLTRLAAALVAASGYAALPAQAFPIDTGNDDLAMML